MKTIHTKASSPGSRRLVVPNVMGWLPLFLAVLLVANACTEPDGEPGRVDGGSTPVEAYSPTAEESELIQKLAALQAQQNYEAGIALAEAYLADRPQTRRLHYALGIFHGSASDHGRALDEFRQELALDPTHVDSYRGLAAAYTALGDTPAAVSSLEKALALAPDDAGVQLDLGRELSNLVRLDEAEPLLLAAARSKHAAAAFSELGTLYRRQNRMDEAVAAFRKALAADPGELAAMSNLGQTLIAQGRVAEGQVLLERHAERVTLQDELDLFRRSSLLEGVTAANFLRLAELQIQMGMEAEAVSSYARALEIDPNATTASLGLAALFLKDGQLREATKWSVHTLMIDPDNSKAHFLLGTLRLARGEVDAAGEAFARSRAARPWDAETFRRAGDSYRISGAFQPAADAYRRSLELDPNDARSHYGLGLVEYLGGRLSAALAACERSIELAPDSPDGPLLKGLVLWEEKRTEEADAAFRAALAGHRVELNAGQSIASLLAPLGVYPRTRPGLARYRALLEEAA